MADLKDYFAGNKNNIVNMIDEKNSVKQLPRPYLGMSQLGEECWRKLWYYFRWCEYSAYDGRVGRIFQTGHNAEIKMIKDLESIGVKCWDTLDAQEAFVEVNGHCQGHGDGAALGIPGAEKTEHLLEFKTSSEKYFKEVVKKGIMESKPTHYAQMVLYMYKKKYSRGLYMVENKNDSSYYTERVKADNTYAKDLIRKAEAIITSEVVDDFDRIGNGTPSFFKCKFCDYSDLCYNDANPVKTCRTCTSVSLLDEGQWGCGLQKDKPLTKEEQAEACPNYNMLECFNG
jgi:hypothetical protein